MIYASKSDHQSEVPRFQKSGSYQQENLSWLTSESWIHMYMVKIKACVYSPKILFCLKKSHTFWTIWTLFWDLTVKAFLPTFAKCSMFSLLQQMIVWITFESLSWSVRIEICIMLTFCSSFKRQKSCFPPKNMKRGFWALDLTPKKSCYDTLVCLIICLKKFFYEI